MYEWYVFVKMQIQYVIKKEKDICFFLSYQISLIRHTVVVIVIIKKKNETNNEYLSNKKNKTIIY